VAISTYADLKAAVLSETLRSTDTTFIGNLPRMVVFAEERMIRGGDSPMQCSPLRVMEMQVDETLTFTAGEAALPAAFLEAVLLFWDTAPKNAPRYEPPTTFHINRRTATSGTPGAYTVRNSKVLLSPPTSGDMVFTYYARPAPLVADGDTNAVLTAYPSLYFNAVLVEAYRHLRDSDRMQEAFGVYRSVLGGIQESDNRRDTGGTSLYPRIPGAYIRGW